MVLLFAPRAVIDIDNYTPASAALKVVRERTVPGGAIVFDHFTGTDRFRFTLGEQIAGRGLINDPGNAAAPPAARS
jgi:O-methyltransferase